MVAPISATSTRSKVGAVKGIEQTTDLCDRRSTRGEGPLLLDVVQADCDRQEQPESLLLNPTGRNVTADHHRVRMPPCAIIGNVSVCS